LKDAASARGKEAREREQEAIEGLELPSRDAEQRVRRAEFGAEKGEVLASLDDLGAWYRDLVVVGAGAEDAAALVRQAWREADELNLNASLMLEALFVRLRRSFS
jgi:hypothetical protein